VSQYITIDGIKVSPDHFINGERVSSTEYFEDYCPIDGQLIGRVAAGLTEHCNAAIEAARDAFSGWAALGPLKRREHLHRFAVELERWGDKLARVECEDNGMLLGRLKGHQIERCALNLSFFADEALKLVNHRIEARNARHHVQYCPAGACVLITPWNSPMMLTTWKLGPALAAGNTVVVKPPEWAPLTCSMLADVATAAGIPPGVINVVQGIGAITGAALVSDPRIARVSFTGSVPTAKSIAQSTSSNLVPTSYELGGKSAFIVLSDADLDLAASTAALQYRNAGQVCLAGTRLLVQDNVADDFLDRMRKVVAQLRVGDPRDPMTEIGPIIHRRQFDKIASTVNRARQRGATIYWGGERHPFGSLFYQPTLIGGVSDDDEVVQNEIFGPVLTIQRFSNDSDAIRMANSTRYGLAGVVFGEQARALAVANQMRTGMVWINSFFLRDLEAPFGGVGDSGIGREGGNWSFEFFCDIKDVMLAQKPYVPAFVGR
jgi:acyl-CoA reductase-like NAD-dependent aldehyde dehydrogenase